MRYRILSMMALVFSLANVAGAITTYQPTGFVNDFANILSPEARQQLDATLTSYEHATSIEVAVATVPSLEGITVEDYAQALFGQWGIGKKGKDNGILFLIAPADRKMRIEVGYGMEPDLTDLQSKAILDEIVRPLFKENKFSEGVTAGVASILSTLGNKPFHQRQEERATAAAAQQRERDLEIQNVKGVLLVILALSLTAGVCALLLMAVRAILRRRREYSDRRQEHRQAIYSLTRSIPATEQSCQKALKQVAGLKAKYPVSVWKDLVFKGSGGNLAAALATLVANAPSNLSQARHVSEALRALQNKMDLYAEFPELVAKRIGEIATAEARVPELFRTQSSLLPQLKTAAQHADVSAATYKLVNDTIEVFEAARKVRSQTPNPDPLYLHEQLQKVSATVMNIVAGIQSERAHADKARTEGPKLLTSIPDLLEKAEKEVSASALSTTKERFEKAHKTFSAGAVDWIVGFAELTAIVGLIQAAIHKAKSDKDQAARKKSSHSSSSSSSSSDYGSSSSSGSSSSGSFDGFGGGSSGGGGASGDW